MVHRWMGPAAARLVLVLLGCAASAEGGGTVVHLKPGVAQLFIDDELIESQQGLERRLHCPVKDEGGNEPIIAARPGTTILAYGTIVFDTRLKKYVMFSQGFVERNMYRFTSKDGLNWDTGEGGEFEEITLGPPPEKEPGAIGKPGIDVFSCFYDTRDGEWPYKGWLYYANYGPNREGIYYVRSQDGRKWDRLNLVVNAWAGPGDTSARRIEQDGKEVYGPGDVTLFYHDPIDNRFLGIFKFFTSEKVGRAGNNLRSRAYHFFDRLDEPFEGDRIDRIALLPPAEAKDNNGPADEFYASTAWRYESLWLGGLKVWHGKDDYPYSESGCAFFKLVVSRDGLNWHKVSFKNDTGVPEVFIPNGPQGGNNGRNDGGYMSEFSQGPLRIGDELIYYYSASSWGKNAPPDKRLFGGGIFRARLRIDGFVSVVGGTLTTKPLVTTGNDLTINATGPVSVAAIGADGRILGEARVTGDSLRHEIRFEGKTLGDLAGGKAVRLRFSVMPPGHLYSFTVR
ncbi:MAG TPA: hypothetical protein PLL20_20110 [Phycisphaerae bacterium]|nr:hypothetical protein [Phycisphaerae bacterium]HRR86648.1 hypothetical protein [Phycisphaerae bacterium]